MARRHTSLKDLAAVLNVSISTVSRALRNHPDISQEMTRRVQDLAQQLNYTPNPLAMGLLRQETRMIGVIIPDLVTHFYSSIISGIESIAKERGYYIVINSSGESYAKEVEAVENLLKTRVEGLIVCLSQETERYDHFDRLISNEIPLVFFDRVCRTGEVPSVVADNFEAARNITRHFYKQGCQRIAYINGPGQLNISREREAGYLAGLAECGLTPDESLRERCDLSWEDARQATRRLLNDPQRPDAIFGVNDTVVFAAMQEIRLHNMKVPADIALVGFTGEFHSIIMEPALSSVVHPTFEMGQTAARLFFERLEKPNLAPRQCIAQTKLIVRASSLRKSD